MFRSTTPANLDESLLFDVPLPSMPPVIRFRTVEEMSNPRTFLLADLLSEILVQPRSRKINNAESDSGHLSGWRGARIVFC